MCLMYVEGYGICGIKQYVGKFASARVRVFGRMWVRIPNDVQFLGRSDVG